MIADEKTRAETSEKQRVNMLDLTKKNREWQEKYNAAKRPEQKVQTRDEKQAEIDRKEITSLKKTLKMEKNESKRIENELNMELTAKDIKIRELDKENRLLKIKIRDSNRTTKNKQNSPKAEKGRKSGSVTPSHSVKKQPQKEVYILYS